MRQALLETEFLTLRAKLNSLAFDESQGFLFEMFELKQEA